MIRIVRFFALLFTALALSTTSAHVLEMPQKMHYTKELYSAVNTSMYKYFAVIGGIYCIGAILFSIGLVFLTHKYRQSYFWAIAGSFFNVLWLISWLSIVLPVNNTISSTLQTNPLVIPDSWMTLKYRWEIGHVIGFIFHLLALSALIISVLTNDPSNSNKSKNLLSDF
jgi:hypothetical protein